MLVERSRRDIPLIGLSVYQALSSPTNIAQAPVKMPTRMSKCPNTLVGEESPGRHFIEHICRDRSPRVDNHHGYYTFDSMAMPGGHEVLEWS